MPQTTWPELVSQYEVLRQRHAQLELQFKQLAAEWPVSVAAHRQLVARLAVHRGDLRNWRTAFRTAAGSAAGTKEASEDCAGA